MNLKKFLKDAGSNYVIYGLQLMLGVVQVPIFLNIYGDSLYGIYLLSIGMASSFLFLQFGSGQTILRYVAEYLEDADQDKYSHAVTICMILSSGSAISAFFIFLLVAVWRNSFFNIPSEYATQSFWLFIAAGIYAFVLFLGQFPKSIVKGAGVFYARNRLALIELCIRGVMIALVYFYAISIYWLLMGEMLILLTGVFFDLIIISKLKTTLLSIDLVRMPSNTTLFSGDVWNYAKQTFLLSLVSFFSQGSDRLVIAIFLDVRFVTIYSIITKPFGILKSLLSKVFIVLNPIFISILKRRGKARLALFVNNNAQLLVLCVGLIAILLTAFIPDLYRLWLGSDKYNSYLIYTQLLIFLLVVRSVTSLHNNALYTIGETSSLLKMSVALVGLNFLISAILTPLIGIAGVLIGTSIQLLFVGPLSLRIMDRFVGNEAEHEGIWVWYILTVMASASSLLLVISAQSTHTPVAINRIAIVVLVLVSIILALGIVRKLTMMRRQKVRFD